VVLGVLAVLLAYRPVTFAGFVERALGRIIGGDVEIDRIEWIDGGDVAIGGVSVRVPDLAGPAGEVIVINDMTLQWSYGTDGFHVDNMVIHESLVRLVEQGDWELTLGGLHLRSALQDRPATSERDAGQVDAPPVSSSGIPRISIESVRLISGELVGDSFTVAGDAFFSGTVTPLADEPDSASFALRERGKGGASFAGTVDLATEYLHAVARGVSLGIDSQQLVPFRSLRRIASQLELEGEVEIDIEVGRNVLPTASMELLSLSLRLDPSVFGEPKDSGFWKMYRNGQVDEESVPPKLFVESGWMKFEDDTFSISGAEGYIDAGARWIDAVQLPYHVDLNVYQLPDIGSMDDMEQAAGILADVPFELSVSAHDFSFLPDRGAVVPSEMARILKMFEVSQCDVDMALTLNRQEQGGDTEASGRLDLSGGRGAYENFPYPLHDLDAIIELRNDDILVKTLVAKGSDESTVRIRGRVDAKRGIDLEVQVYAENVPLDEVLLDAVPPRAEVTLREVFSREHINEPAGNGFAHQRVDLALLVEQELVMTSSGDEDYELRITGTIPFQDLQMTWAEFPVTLDLKEGWLRWADDMMFLEQEDGTPISIETSQGGGQGTLAGAIHIPEGDGPGGGSIDFAIDDERIDANLRQAMLHVSRGETEPLSKGGLEGILQATGHVAIEGDDVGFDVSTTLRRGSLLVTPSLTKMIGMDLNGPLGGMSLLHLDGTIRLGDESGVVFDPMLVRAGGIDAQIVGTLDGRDALRVDATGLNIGRWVLDYVSDRVRSILSDLWTVRNPAGQFAISTLLKADSEGTPSVTSLEIVDVDVELEPAQRVLLRDGVIRFEEEQVEFAAVRAAVMVPDVGVSQLEMRGVVHLGDGDTDLKIDSEYMVLELPMLGDLIAILAGDEGDRVWQSMLPRGDVALHAMWQQTRHHNTWGVEIEPRNVSAMWRETRLEFADGGGSRLRLQPEGLVIDRLAGEAGGIDVDVEGLFGFEPHRVRIGGVCHGSLESSLLAAFAGPSWSRVLQDLEFADQSLTTIDAIDVNLEEGAGGWSGAIGCEIALHEAAMTTGVRLTKVSADVEVGIQLLNDQPLFDLVVRDAKGLAIKAPFQGLRGRIVSAPTPDEPDRLELDALVGELGGGRVVIDGAVESDSWRVDIALANGRLARLFPSKDAKDGEASPTGEVDAAIHLRGQPGHPEKLTGAGSFRVLRGHLRTLPAFVAIQQVLHLSSPVVGALAFVDVDFVIQGGHAILETITLASGPTGQGGFSLVGEGTLEIETMEVDADLRPRGAWPIVSDVIGAIQDQLYGVTMTGHIGDPDVGFQAFPGLLGGRSGR
jgi:hypothetical protein